MTQAEQIWLVAVFSACGLGTVLAIYIGFCAWREQRNARNNDEMRRHLRRDA